MPTIEEFIDQKVLPEYRDIVSSFRKLIKETYPQISEEMRGGTEKYYGVPVYRLNRIIITLSPTKQGITFSFSDGAKFDDKYKLLEGVGSKTLNLRIKKIDDFDEAVLKYYTDQAMQVDS